MLTSLSKILLASPVSEATGLDREIFDLKFLKKDKCSLCACMCVRTCVCVHGIEETLIATNERFFIEMFI